MSWLGYLFQALVYTGGLFTLYRYHGFYANQSYGYGQIQISFEYIILFIFSVVFCISLFARRYKKPSDYFLLFYGLTVVVPYAILHDIYRVNDGRILIDIALLLIPFFFVMLICNINLKLTQIKLVNERYLFRFFLLFSMVVLSLLICNPPSSASFSLIDSYERRHEARVVYISGGFIAYGSSMVMNGVLPLLVFLGVLNKTKVYWFIGLLFYCIFYYIYGVKAPLLYMLFAGIFGYSVRNDTVNAFYNIFIYAPIFLMVISWIEIVFYDYSYVEDYLIRRIYYGGSFVMGAYFNYFDSNYFSWSVGLLGPGMKSISMYIGEDFLGLDGLNANTNTFIYFLGQYGVFGYVFSIILVGILLSLFNFIGLKRKVLVFISVLYSILILEQSATTALVSSGILLITLSYYFSKQKSI